MWRLEWACVGCASLSCALIYGEKEKNVASSQVSSKLITKYDRRSIDLLCTCLTSVSYRSLVLCLNTFTPLHIRHCVCRSRWASVVLLMLHFRYKAFAGAFWYSVVGNGDWVKVQPTFSYWSIDRLNKQYGAALLLPSDFIPISRFFGNFLSPFFQIALSVGNLT